MKLCIDLKWQNYRYFPYEKRLAVREVKTLLGGKLKYTKSGLRVTLSKLPLKLLERLTYFREIHLNGRKNLIPFQARLEAPLLLKQTRYRTRSASQEEGPTLTRQSTRYSAHGLHEYKGKFNPQIVRATGNLLGLPQDAWVLDPFCGSGTCLLECAHVGWNALGIDLNPLGVFISNAKLDAMRVDVKILQEQADDIVKRLHERARGLDLEEPLSLFGYRRLRPPVEVNLPNRAYLKEWFPSSVLAQLECIEGEIRRLENGAVQSIARAVLSHGLRIISWQDPGDLRIRRRKDPAENYPAIPWFVAELTQRTQAIGRARTILGKVQGLQYAIMGDSRHGLPGNISCLPSAAHLFDCVITSPPYATALPYIDTQRLSLAFLGLLQQDDLRVVEKSLIGNREITPREREYEEAEMDRASDLLPEEVVNLCGRTRRLAGQSDSGFRRRNVPALLFRYFRDMRCVFASVLPLVRPGKCFALVVGSNRTTLAGEEITIDTPRLLAKVAQHAGWQVNEMFPLDAYPRFDLHRKNSIMAESLMILQRPAGVQH
ncbi:MAG: RNA methylase [candidate division NC10 bacterium]|nr:RNA methylase [candidate division NC10 bacterium]